MGAGLGPHPAPLGEWPDRTGTVRAWAVIALLLVTVMAAPASSGQAQPDHAAAISPATWRMPHTAPWFSG